MLNCVGYRVTSNSSYLLCSVCVHQSYISYTGPCVYFIHYHWVVPAGRDFSVCSWHELITCSLTPWDSKWSCLPLIKISQNSASTGKYLLFGRLHKSTCRTGLCLRNLQITSSSLTKGICYWNEIRHLDMTKTAKGFDINDLWPRSHSARDLTFQSITAMNATASMLTKIA